MEGFTIVFHRDFDGVLSATLLHHYLRSLDYCPIHLRAAEPNQMVDVPPHTLVVSVDLPAVPGTHLWIDHHRHSSAPDETTLQIVKPHYPSCAAVVHGLLPEQVVLPFEEAILWAGLIDTSAYMTHPRALWSTTPALQLARALDHPEEQSQFACLLVTLLSNEQGNLAKVAQHRCVKTRARRQLEALRDVAEELKKNSEVTEVDGISCCVSVHRGNHWHPLLPFSIHPDAAISISGVECQGYCRVHLTRNPMHTGVNTPDLGRIMAAVGGGGHFNAAAVTLPASTALEPIMETVLSALRGAQKNATGGQHEAAADRHADTQRKIPAGRRGTRGPLPTRRQPPCGL